MEYDDVAVCSQKLSGPGPKRLKKVEKLNILKEPSELSSAKRRADNAWYTYLGCAYNDEAVWGQKPSWARAKKAEKG
jgi:hypothetical protein